MELGLKGKCVIVTGGSHGIGRSIALELAREGCNVAICSRSMERINPVVEEIKSKGVKALGIKADALIGEDIDKVVETVVNKWGTVHILVNNVGGGGRWGSEDVEKTEEKVWLEVYSKNALAAVRFTRRVLPYMRKQKWGRVVTISSRFGKEGGGRPWYNMAKSAEISLMKTLALRPDLTRSGITFNSLAPGGIMIPGTGWDDEAKKDPEAFKAMMDRDFPLGRPGTPDEIASVAAFVCSERASLLNGACIAVDGAESKCF